MQFHELKTGTSYAGSDIKAYKTGQKAKKYLYLIAGVHGDEVEGVYVLQELWHWLNKIDDYELPIVLVPIVNVDGHQAQIRTNSRGVDLNRNLPTKDWTWEYQVDKYNPGQKPLSEPENIFLDSLFKDYAPGLILSFHSWKPLINTNGDCFEEALYLSHFNHYPISEDVGYPTPGSLGSYGPEKYKCPVITFECPKLDSHKALKDIWQENRMALQGLMGHHKLLSKKIY